MSNPLIHAERSAKKWGGTPQDYLDIHRWFDSSKAMIRDNRHRMLLHHSFGILLAEQVFGSAIPIGPTRRVFVRDIGALHVLEDLGFIPTPAQCRPSCRCRPGWPAARASAPLGDLNSPPYLSRSPRCMPTESPLYDVHLFAVIRRKLTAIAADSPHAAIEATLESPLLRRWLTKFDDAEAVGEFAEEFSHFLVDVVGDEEFAQSRWFYSDSDPLLRPLRALLQWDEAGRDPVILEELLADVRPILNHTV